MKNTVLDQFSEMTSIEQQKNEIRSNIKTLQRDLIKASFKQTSAPGIYSELLLAINVERAKLKQLNQAAE